MPRPGYISESTYPNFKRPYKSILIIKCNGVSDFRVELAGRYLARDGYDVELISEVPFYKSGQHDLFICSRPSVDMCDFLSTCQQAGKKVIIDMDDDFLSIPRHNEAYPYIGAGNMGYHQKLMRTLEAADAIVYASPELINRYKLPGVVIPNCWDPENPAWGLNKSDILSDYFRVGFTGTRTHREDFKIAYPAIRQFMHDYPDTAVVIGVDEQIHGMFTEIDKRRVSYIPPLTYDMYPNYYRYIDILLAVLKDTHFNRAKSDIKLVEAGASRTPYIASRLPVYEAWTNLSDPHPGALASETEWYEALKLAYILAPDQRATWANAGYDLAANRAADKTYLIWSRIVEDIIND